MALTCSSFDAEQMRPDKAVGRGSVLPSIFLQDTKIGNVLKYCSQKKMLEQIKTVQHFFS
jgi:hypothetical protein